MLISVTLQPLLLHNRNPVSSPDIARLTTRPSPLRVRDFDRATFTRLGPATLTPSLPLPNLAQHRPDLARPPRGRGQLRVPDRDARLAVIARPPQLPERIRALPRSDFRGHPKQKLCRM